LATLTCKIKTTLPQDINAQVDHIFWKAKLSFNSSLLMVRNNYNSFFSVFTKAQILTDLHFLYLIFKYLYLNAPNYYPNLQENQIDVEQGNLRFSLDYMSSSFWMQIPLTEDNQSQILFFLKKSLLKIEKRVKNLEANHQLRLDWLKIMNFLIKLIHDQIKTEFDEISYKVLYKLFKFTYRNDEMLQAKVYYEKLVSTFQNLRNFPIKSLLFLAKFAKKYYGKKTAIKILSSQAIENSHQGNIKVKANLKIVEYMNTIYTVLDREKKYLEISEKFSQKDFFSPNESKNPSLGVFHFKYAKFIDQSVIKWTDSSENEIRKVIEVVRHYLISAKYGHQFINESLSRGLRIWIDHCLKNLKQESSSLKNHGK